MGLRKGTPPKLCTHLVSKFAGQARQTIRELEAERCLQLIPGSERFEDWPACVDGPQGTPSTVPGECLKNMHDQTGIRRNRQSEHACIYSGNWICNLKTKSSQTHTPTPMQHSWEEVYSCVNICIRTEEISKVNLPSEVTRREEQIKLKVSREKKERR